MVNSRVD